MSTAAPLPSLFGRFTAILKEHDHLGTTLRRVRAMCAALEEASSELPLELSPSSLLADLEADLRQHFAAEESEDYFGTVLAEAPALSREIAALKWEHLLMLRALEVLGELSRDRARWADLPAPTRELIGQLERHEGAETKLLRALFKP